MLARKQELNTQIQQLIDSFALAFFAFGGAQLATLQHSLVQSQQYG
jgi:hypothetical protein